MRGSCGRGGESIKRNHTSREFFQEEGSVKGGIRGSVFNGQGEPSSTEWRLIVEFGWGPPRESPESGGD